MNIDLHQYDIRQATFARMLERFVDTHLLRDESGNGHERALDVADVVIYLTQRAMDMAGCDRENISVAQLHANALLMIAISDILSEEIGESLQEVGAPAIKALFGDQFGKSLDDYSWSAVSDYYDLDKTPIWNDRLLDVTCAALDIVEANDFQRLPVLASSLEEMHAFYTQGNPSRGFST